MYQVNELKSTIAKWTDEKNDIGVSKIKDTLLKNTTALVLESINKEYGNIIEEASDMSMTHSGAYSDGTNTAAYGVGGFFNGQPSAKAYEFAPVTFALARRVMPSLFAHKIVPTQPMSGPVGIAFAKRTVYANSVASASDRGVEAGWENVPEYSGYSGGYATGEYDYDYDADGVQAAPGSGATRGTQGQAGPAGGRDTGLGAYVEDAEGWKLGGAGAIKWPELTTKLDSKTIRARERMLAATFSIQALDDIMAMHNFDLKMDMINTLQYEVTAELDRELLAAVKWTAVNGDQGGSIASVDISSVSDMRAKTAIIVNSIIYAANVVAKRAKRGRANFAVVSPAVASVLQAATPYFTANTSAVDPGIILSGAETTEIGKLNNALTIYLDHQADEEYALVGYKGNGIQDGGVIFSPYIMNVLHTATEGSNFQPRVGVMSRYAITTSLLGAGSYYRLIKFAGLNTVTGINLSGLQGW